MQVLPKNTDNTYFIKLLKNWPTFYKEENFKHSCQTLNKNMDNIPYLLQQWKSMKNYKKNNKKLNVNSPLKKINLKNGRKLQSQIKTNRELGTNLIPL